jgi:hypothetical protein
MTHSAWQILLGCLRHIDRRVRGQASIKVRRTVVATFLGSELGLNAWARMTAGADPIRPQSSDVAPVTKACSFKSGDFRIACRRLGDWISSTATSLRD